MNHVRFQEVFSCQEDESNPFRAAAVHLRTTGGVVYSCVLYQFDFSSKQSGHLQFMVHLFLYFCVK